MADKAKRVPGASPRPWRTDADIGCPWNIVDANGEPVAITQQRVSGQADFERDANTALIVEAVNSRDSLLRELDHVRRVTVAELQARIVDQGMAYDQVVREQRAEIERKDAKIAKLEAVNRRAERKDLNIFYDLLDACIEGKITRADARLSLDRMIRERF